jgi:hypothetical protein
MKVDVKYALLLVQLAVKLTISAQAVLKFRLISEWHSLKIINALAKKVTMVWIQQLLVLNVLLLVRNVLVILSALAAL